MLSRHFLKGRHQQQHLSSSSSLSFSSLSQLISASSPRGGGGGGGACRSRNIPIITTLAHQQPKHDDGGGGGGGNVCRFKSTSAAPRRLNNNDNKKNESSSSPASSSFASSFWDAAASTIQSAVGLSSNAVAQQSSLYFQTLRWKAANALMTSLSDSERQQLLQRLGISATTNNNDSDNNNSNNSNNGMNSVVANNETVADHEMENKSSPSVVVLSVAEAVAAARVQEAMRNSAAETNTAKQRQHREELWRQAQQATHARVATEIATLQQQQQQQQHSTEKVDDATEAATATNNIETTDHHHHHHPILGPVVYDLGYKRCHVVSARQLTSIPVWEKQRIYRHDRAKSMAKDKLKSLHLGMPGVIALHQDVHGNLSILDGQHRVGMMAILADEMEQQQQQQPQENVEGNSSSNQAHFDLTRILVEVYPESKNSSRSSSESSSSSSHAADLFVEINKAEPVKLVDLPGMGAKKSEAHVINQGAHALHERYPEMFSASQRCRAPHLNLDNLRDALFQAQVVTRQKLKTPKALEVWLLEQNDALKQKYNNVNGDGDESSTSSSWDISKAALEKARKYDFYLGLETSWLSK
jgi:hypothetical protein